MLLAPVVRKEIASPRGERRAGRPLGYARAAWATCSGGAGASFEAHSSVEPQAILVGRRRAALTELADPASVAPDAAGRGFSNGAWMCFDPEEDGLWLLVR